jgi:hypothetical protein
VDTPRLQSDRQPLVPVKPENTQIVRETVSKRAYSFLSITPVAAEAARF